MFCFFCVVASPNRNKRECSIHSSSSSVAAAAFSGLEVASRPLIYLRNIKKSVYFCSSVYKQ